MNLSVANIESGSQPQAQFGGITELLQKGVTNGVFPGAVLLFAKGGQPLYHHAVGNKWIDPPEGAKNEMTRDTVFDLGALSALISTTTLVMKLVEGRKLALEDRVARYIQPFGVLGKSKIAIEDLLSHSAGFPVWLPLFEDLVRVNAGEKIGILTSRGAREHVYNVLNRMEPKYQIGSKQLYSDLDFILLGNIIETLTGLSLDKAAYRFIFQPLGLRSTSFVDLAMIKRRGIHPVIDRIAPTEQCGWRKRVLCGEVHDDNAWVMGGIAGHSGVFSNALDLHAFASEILNAYRGEGLLLKRDTVRRFFLGAKNAENGAGYKLGWEAPNKENGMAESKLSPQAVGICGFTGCSLWIEPEQNVSILLLTNRIHPDRSNKQIRTYRAELHDAVLESLKIGSL